MEEFEYKACVIGDLTPRQKLMTVRLLRENIRVIAMDEHNAKTQNLCNKAEFMVIFLPTSSPEFLDDTDFFDRLLDMGWAAQRILSEGDDFDIGMLPSFGEQK